MSRPLHVVVGYDFSHSGRVALHRAVALAAHDPRHALHVICAIDPGAPIPSIPSYDGVDAMYAARVQEALALETQHELDAYEVIGRVHFFVHAPIDHDAASAILALARDVGADLIIIGSHGLTSIERLLLGSTSERITREARCTVEVARQKRYPDVVSSAFTASADADRVPPHRYEYEDHRVHLRPPEWPIY